MNSDLPLDYALFQLSPRRTRCELFVSWEGKTEKLASGYFKPFMTHLKVAEEQASHAVHLIKLEVGRRNKVASWFNKGTVERFVRFVSTPEVLELVHTFDEEMSQLEGARKVYAQGAGDTFADESEIKSAAAADGTKKELLRAIDLRRVAVKQDLSTACARASAAGFNLESVSDLLFFADQFGAFRLREACKKFLSLHQRRPELISHQHSLPSAAINPQWKSFDDANVRSSSGSDMSIDQAEVEQTGSVRLTSSNCSDAQMSTLFTQHQQKAVGDPTASSSEQLNQDPHHFLEEGMEKVGEYPAPSAAFSVEPALRPGGGSKRLSVQDRINLFESKQKEQSASSNIGSASSGGPILSKLAGAKGEHRRNPSDVSVEKSVLRRWSGASDMSIDLNSSSNSNNDRKESGSAAGTPTSSSNPQLQTSCRNTETESSSLIEAKKTHSLSTSKSSLIATTPTISSQDNERKFPRGETQNRDAIHREGIASISVEPPGLTLKKEQALTGTHLSDSLDRVQQGGLHDQIVAHSRGKDFSNCRLVTESKEPATSLTNFPSASEGLAKEEMMSQIPSREAPALALPTEPNQASFLAQPTDQKEADGFEKTQATSVIKFKPYTSKREDAGAKSKDGLDSQIQLKTCMNKVEDASAKAGSVRPHTHRSSTYGEQREAKEKTLASPQVQPKDVSSETKQGSSSQGLRFLGKTSGTDQRKFHGGKDAIVPNEGSNAPGFLTSKLKEGMEATPSSSLEESRTVRSNKGNHELNDVLQMKADELERLFAEHKLRIHGDQVASTQRSKTLNDYSTKSVENMPAQSPTKQIPKNSLLMKIPSKAVEFNPDLFLKIDDNFDLSGAQRQKLGNHTPDDTKGKFYSKYMQKRDAKLREECGSKRVENEAKMKSMHDILELSQAEMKARFAGFSGRRNLTHVRYRTEKMRSFNFGSTSKSKDQWSESLTGDWDDDEQELSEYSVGNQSKKFLPNKTLSSTSRTLVSPTSKNSVKSSNSGTLRRKVQSENPITQSVASFSELKNENIRPLMVVGKATTRGQPRSFARSKSSLEDEEIVKEDGSRRSNSMRKSSASPNQLKDLSSLNSEEILNKVQISSEFKQYLKKGNGTHHGSGAVMRKLRTSIMSGELKNKEKSEELVRRHEDSPDMVNDDDDFDRTSTEGDNLVMNHDGGIGGPNQQSEEPESENCDVRTLFHPDDSTMISSKFNSRNAHYSPEESSESWNLHIHHSLAYTQEASDVDASVDSPTDSPALWSSQSLSQIMDSDIARMRKKWGNAQIPVIAASSSHQSRRDVTKGFKRLLKFGRKNRGTDYLVNDWVSASTTSEGDDDPEDGRDLVPRSSDDFRKSRMGYTITAYEGFSEDNIFPEQSQSLVSSIPNPSSNFRLGDDHLTGNSIKALPRSFFSLSSFRSKPSDSKPR